MKLVRRAGVAAIAAVLTVTVLGSTSSPASAQRDSSWGGYSAPIDDGE